MQIIYVLVELTARALDRPFSYLDENDEVKCPGVRVKITFNNRHLVGYVVDVKKDDRTKEEILSSSPFLMTNIDEVIDDTPLLDEDLLTLANMMKDYYLSPLISIYQAMLPPSLKPTRSSFNAPKIRYDSYVRISKDSDETFLSVKQLEMYRFIKNEKEVAKKDLKNHITVVNNLIKLGKLELFKREVYRTSGDDTLFEERKKVVLNDEQKNVCEDFLRSEDDVYLLHGVTGSGKTEIYLHLASLYLKEGKSVLFLVPEISLTPLMVSYFKSRFKGQVAILHSDLTNAEKYDEYRKISRGDARVVVGARSAIFAPLNNLGLIILDEEHVESYKQDNTPYYHAREVAIMRGKISQAKVLLGSATPSLESYARALKGTYHLLKLTKRIHSLPLPKVEIVDSSDAYVYDKNSIIFSIPLREEMKKALARKEQIILLLNRRGFATRLECRRCGHIFLCPECHVPLVYHRRDELLKCHRCGHVEQKVEHCPECGSNRLSILGFGTEKLEEEVHRLFPLARTLRLDKDIALKRANVRRVLKQFFDGEADILIGTQMVAKGHDFANVSLVGVVNADIGLAFSSFRSAETSFELITQAVGRAGRKEKIGHAIIQTYNPSHYAITCGAKQDYESFFVKEMKVRKNMNNPPYYYLSAIYVETDDEDDCFNSALSIMENLGDELENNATVMMDDSKDLVRLNNKFRATILLKYKKFEIVKPSLLNLIVEMNKNRKIHVDVDVDALNV